MFSSLTVFIAAGRLQLSFRQRGSISAGSQNSRRAAQGSDRLPAEKLQDAFERNC
eukprot:SAG11_NODE_17812_length_508_cov_0.943765_1_plen_54_part_10